MFCHEINRLGADMIGGDDEIAFIFTIFFVNQDHHPAGAKLGNDFLGRGKFIWHSPLF